MQTNTQNPIHRWLYKEQEKREKVKGGNSGGTPKTPTFCMLSLYYLPKLFGHMPMLITTIVSKYGFRRLIRTGPTENGP